MICKSCGAEMVEYAAGYWHCVRCLACAHPTTEGYGFLYPGGRYEEIIRPAKDRPQQEYEYTK
jgi:hypothetical protein